MCVHESKCDYASTRLRAHYSSIMVLVHTCVSIVVAGDSAARNRASMDTARDIAPVSPEQSQ